MGELGALSECFAKGYFMLRVRHKGCVSNIGLCLLTLNDLQGVLVHCDMTSEWGYSSSTEVSWQKN